MKNTLVMLVVFGFYFSASSQELMTIGEIFDFEINDEFHFSSNLPGQPPNADRISIIDKYYSINGDTINYVQAHDSYWTSLNYEPPYLTYYFWTDTVWVKYYDLDSSIFYYDVGFQSDTSIYYSENHCDSLVSECQYYLGGTLEPDYYRNTYGRGLGLVSFYLEQGGNYDPTLDVNLFYYKKNGITCGTPDTTVVGIRNDFKEFKEFEIYPNPTKSKVFVRNNYISEIFELSLFNSSGKQVYNNTLSGEMNEINIQDFEVGIYFLKIIRDGKTQTFKLIKK